MAQVTPEVLWAQRSSASEAAKNTIYLTISTPDVSASSLDLKLTPTGLTFTGYSETKKITYHVELEFFKEIDVENSKTIHTARDVELVLRKKEMEVDYWPRLLQSTQKMHFLKTDFDKWVDEDEQNGAPDDVPGMGGDDGGFGGIDFSKLGAGGGMGGMDGMDDMDMGGADDDDDDDEGPPELEEEVKEDASGAAKTEDIPTAETAQTGAKIEEVS
ncbi:hypothetical protein GP486_002378 [Trichoglossum hirsutum]|uniref:CS domain-containing protein n=1 Tax=Trichoglossum hirsutum TaxID=265104 RepID=A0A9P8RRR0_9PEZI|nr:hypothetical protein GP486_002378 [Trichoglossum hirsutum]